MTNPADWLLDLISVDTRGGQEEVTKARVEEVLHAWTQNEDKSIETRVTKGKNPLQMDGELGSDEPASMLVALPVVVERMVKNMWRQKPGTFILDHAVATRSPWLRQYFSFDYTRRPSLQCS